MNIKILKTSTLTEATELAGKYPLYISRQRLDNEEALEHLKIAIWHGQYSCIVFTAQNIPSQVICAAIPRVRPWLKDSEDSPDIIFVI